MAVTQTLTVSTAGSPFVASNTPGSVYTLPEGGLAYPDFDVRINYVPDTDDVPGSQPRAATLGVGNMPCQIIVNGTSTADLQTKRRALEAAFSQFTYTVTIAVGGQNEVYTAFMAWPRWGAVNSGEARQFIAVATLAVPVNPMGA